MTKFILMGGYISRASDGGKAFCEELIEGFDQPVRILDCMFARPKDSWAVAFEEDKLFFAKNLRMKILVTLADPAAFTEQVHNADAVYLRGGSTESLLGMLAAAPGWDKELIGKTLAGSSAGAMAIVASSYSLDALKCRDGLGLLPIKVIPHWKSDYNTPNVDWDKALDDMKAYGDQTAEVLTIGEGEFVVRSK